MNKTRIILNGLLILALLVFVLPTGRVNAAGTVYYVRANASGSNNGTSWANAYKDLQSAISAASTGDEIWVAKGTYKPTNGINRNLSFKLKAEIALYGGFAGTETQRTQRNWTTNITVLSGDIGTANNAADNSLHVVYIDDMDSVTLDGFTISAGNATGTFANGKGGGIYSVGNADLLLENLEIANNKAKIEGGGLYNGGGMNRGIGTKLNNVRFMNNVAADGGGMYNLNSSPNITKTTFTENTATATGGGMKNLAYDDFASPTLNNVLFSNNTASEGGGLLNGSFASFDFDAYSTPHLINVNFINNKASKTGGGLQNNSYPEPDFGGWGALNPVLKNVNFINNSADIAGGGMENHFHANPTLTGVTFSGNSAPKGAGVSNIDGSTVTLTNVTFNGNIATDTGNWMYNADSSASFTNITVSDNTGSNCGLTNSQANMTVINSIFWGNGATFCESTPGTLKNSIIQGGCPTGITCSQVSTSDPLLGTLKNNGGFTKTMAFSPNSPARDRGNGEWCPETDQRGTERMQGPGCDIGAYEKEQTAVALSSQAVNDGWILEWMEGTGAGATMNNSAANIYVGDDDMDRQYRAILSFNTASLALPANAVISGARLKLKSQNTVADNLAIYYDLGNLIFDIRKGPFGDEPALQLRDFTAASTQDNVGNIAKVPVNGLYIKTWLQSIAPSINLNGVTQFRLRLAETTDNDMTADALNFYSGDAAAANRPQLIVYYYVP